MGWRSLLALTVLAALVYHGVTGASFLNQDDVLFFGPENPQMRAAMGGDLGALLDPRRTIANAYLPVSHLSLLADVWLIGDGGAAVWPHLHSLFLHLAAAFILARLLGQLGLTRASSTAAAALFLVHPALVESVAWIASRKDLLSGLFSFLCLSAVARHALVPRHRTVAMAMIWAVLALYSKGTAVVLALLAPVVVSLVAGSLRGRWRLSASIASLAFLAGLHHSWVAAGEGTLQTLDFATRTLQIPGAFAHYLGTIVWPTGLNIHYPEVKTLSIFVANWLLGLASFGLPLLGLMLWHRGHRQAGAGIIMACLALLPFNTAYPASAIAAADRYLYLVVPWFAFAFVSMFGSRSRMGLSLVVIAVLPMGWLAHSRVAEFRDSRTLWASSLATEPENAVACLNLAEALQHTAPDRAFELAASAVKHARYIEHRLRSELTVSRLARARGSLAEAAVHAEVACTVADEILAPEPRREAFVRAAVHAANVAIADEKPEPAQEYLEKALARYPEHPLVRSQQALMLLRGSIRKGLDPEGHVADDAVAARAEELLEAALGEDPGHFWALIVKAHWQAARGHYLTAHRTFKKAAAADPRRPEPWVSLADLLLATGEPADAEQVVRQALAGGFSKEPDLQVRLAYALHAQGRLDDARRYFEDYLRLRPQDLAIKRVLAGVLVADATRRLNQLAPTELAERVQRVRELDPQDPKGDLLEGVLERHRRRMDRALVLLEKAFAALPEDRDARRYLAETCRDRGYQLLSADGVRESALDHFRRFVDIAPPAVPIAAAEGILRTHWKRWNDRGIAAFNMAKEVSRKALGAGISPERVSLQRRATEHLGEAEAAFRRCLFLLPTEPEAARQLAVVLIEGGGKDRLEEALRHLEAAESVNRRLGMDVASCVLYQVWALRGLERDQEALKRGRRYFESPPPAPASAKVLERLRAQLAEIEGGRSKR